MTRYTESFLQKVTNDADCSIDFLKIVSAGYAEQIRHVPNAAGRILIELPQVVKLYGGRQDIDSEVLKECAKLIVEKFGMISVLEIKEAYRQWSTGETNIKGAEMYFGEFNAGQLGKILGAYTDRRKKVLGVYLREKEEMQEAQSREEKKRIMKEAFDREFPLMIEAAKLTVTDWRDIPAFWYEAANNRGMIHFDRGEAVQIFKDAQDLAKLELQAEQEEKVMYLGDVFRRENKDPLERAKVIARKLTVFRKLIQ